MRFTSDLIYRWIRAQGAGDSRPDEAEIEIPPVIVPVITVPGPFRDLGTALISTEIQRESFAMDVATNRAASQPEASPSLCTFGRGLWKIRIHFMHHSDFTGVPSAVGGVLFLGDPAGGAAGIARFGNIANASQMVVVEFFAMFNRDGWLLGVTQGATGVGQTMRTGCDGLLQRMN